ncbi:MAG: transcriptional regulator [Oceanospirillaceae bacterium]|nr:transcriptional regulator [Oceanospirillaceae bacterium]|tara:strand:- start:3111 stop:4553 length:1443 start_codon:yes stop_codon:yes gene_type:complete
MSAKLKLDQLRFDLPQAVMAPYRDKLEVRTRELDTLARKSGTGSEKFKKAFARFFAALGSRGHIADAITESIDIRALAIALKTRDAVHIKLDSRLLEKVDAIKPRPGSLLVESLYSHYLKVYDELEDLQSVEAWLRQAKTIRGELDENTARILSGAGPKWLVESSHEQQVDFDVQVSRVGLGSYLSGRFLATAKNIYYLETLRTLRPGENHNILHEVQKPEVYSSLYENGTLLGHEILKILISRADVSQIPEHWMNVIMAIAGDPRVSRQSERFVRWWSHIPEELIAKVRGWLSKLDLKLFLEALKNFADEAKQKTSDITRMYPERKRFLEGLLDQQLVTGTRLFLSKSARDYLKRHYKKEHLPSFSLVDGDKSIVYISLPGAHVVEGTHVCKFWIYKKLSDAAVVFNYNKTEFLYSELTSGMNMNMIRQKVGPCQAAIVHRKEWEIKAAYELRNAEVEVDAEAILSKEYYKKYKNLGYL